MKIFSTITILIICSATTLLAKPRIKVGASLYEDSIREVVDPDVASSVGNVAGVSIKTLLRHSFYEDQFYFRYGLSLDQAFAKVVNDRGIKYTVDQNRIEAPLTIGIYLAINKGGFYIGTGIVYAMYNLSLKTHDENDANSNEEEIKYSGSGLGRISHIGGYVSLNKNWTF